MDNTPMLPKSPAPAMPPEETTDEFSVPVTVASTPPKPGPEVKPPLETVEPPLPNGGLPPAEPEIDSSITGQEIPQAPLAAPATNPGDIKASSGKTLQELLAEEEAKSPSPDLSNLNKPKRKGLGVKVLIIVLLLAALGGGAGYAYIQTNKKVKPESTPAPATTQTEPEDTSLKAEDLDKTSSDLDASLKKVDDVKDYSATDLSDTTLGL